MTDAEILLDAATVLEAEASALYQCHTNEDGNWGEDDEDARSDYEHWLELAVALRQMAER